MFQVSFVDESTADLVGCSVQANNGTSAQGERKERGKTEMVRARHRKRAPKLLQKYPDQGQE